MVRPGGSSGSGGAIANLGLDGGAIEGDGGAVHESAQELAELRGPSRGVSPAMAP